MPLLGHSACIERLPYQNTTELADFTVEKITANNLTTREQRQYVFPSLNFTCSGQIFKWRIAAPDIRNGNGRVELSIWRRNVSNTYDKVGNQLLDSCIVESTTAASDTVINIQENFLNASILAFQPGDVLGLYVRRTGIFQFSPYFLDLGEGEMKSYYTNRNAPETTLTFDDNFLFESILPLLSIEICKFVIICELLFYVVLFFF